MHGVDFRVIRTAKLDSPGATAGRTTGWPKVCRINVMMRMHVPMYVSRSKWSSRSGCNWMADINQCWDDKTVTFFESTPAAPWQQVCARTCPSPSATIETRAPDLRRPIHHHDLALTKLREICAYMPILFLPTEIFR